MKDSDAFLIGALGEETWDPLRSVGITLGTGIGSAFAVGAEIVHSGEGVPASGEIWNLPYNAGTIEDTISTRTLETAYTSRTGLGCSVKAIAKAASEGERTALDVFHEFGEQLAAVLEHVCEPFRAERILLGGGITGAAAFFLPALSRNRWCKDRVSIVQDCDSAPLIGAGSAWKAQKISVASRHIMARPVGEACVVLPTV